jgi:hypothetical protein
MWARMSDPLSISSSLGLIPLCQAIVNYTYSAKNAKNGAQKLVYGLSTTQHALKESLISLDGRNGNSFDRNLQGLRSTAFLCLGRVDSLLKKLWPIAQGDSSVLEQMRWPFFNKEIQDEVKDLKENAQMFLGIAQL